MKIILYDIPSRTHQKAWSPNTWKTRYCLNYKGIPYRTEWVEYQDTQQLYQNLGLKSKSALPDGTPRHTLPVIHDPSTGVSMNESFDIAQYLDSQYPTTPKVFPNHSECLQAAFSVAFADHLRPIWNFVTAAECGILNPCSAVLFHQSREKLFGVERLEDLTPKGEERVREWKKLEKGFGMVAAWYAMNWGSGPFMWDKPCWADFVIGGYMMWIRSTLGEESEEWRDIMGWNGGRWKDFVEGLKWYEDVV